MTDRASFYPANHPVALAALALTRAIRLGRDPFPELEAAAASVGVRVGSEEFDEAAALAGQPYCRALDLYVDKPTKRRADALGPGMAHLAFLPT